MRSYLPLFLFAILALSASAQVPAQREFRAAWIATVDNIDFPSKRTLTIEEQRAELIRALDLAHELKLNAVIFQVRPMADALYRSSLEPWSEFLTGKMGRAQTFDPLTFIIAEAHKRGILVHAWFNPYRAYHPGAKTISANHISKKRPDLVRKYGQFLWMDPGEKEVQQHSLKVVLDVVRRYDIDGVHFDDYFYPYPEVNAAGKRIEFPDNRSWLKYKKAGGTLARDDWRRKNVDDFIATVGLEVKKIKPEVMYGVSPFGIWQPLPEKDIKGFNAYAELYADAKKWLQDGTVDYLAPQLYWETGRNGLSYPVLLEWWSDQNTKGRHIWPGLATYRIGSNPAYNGAEIVNQIKLTRNAKPSAGSIHFSFKSLSNDLGGVQRSLRRDVFQRDALIPASPWIISAKPLAPVVRIERRGAYIRATWTERGPRKAFWFVVNVKDKTGWNSSVIPAAEKGITLSASRGIEKIEVSSVDRLGNESAAAEGSIR